MASRKTLTIWSEGQLANFVCVWRGNALLARCGALLLAEFFLASLYSKCLHAETLSFAPSIVDLVVIVLPSKPTALVSKLASSSRDRVEDQSSGGKPVTSHCIVSLMLMVAIPTRSREEPDP
ncbi:hypothetical protein Cni_G13529 [Canna indica]|uniref:Uncharacterized protein n=1 Tax=Canna indica TaxID=4628 RepID=A0AAQ3KA26_9LILI|nr:hypothetical protein Cni_G13529 [Canna indica]